MDHDASNTERPLASLHGIESALAIERLRGEVWVELTRLEERLGASVHETERNELSGQAALKLAADELARRLEILNHAHQEALRVQGTYVPRETFDAATAKTDDRLKLLELDYREGRGRWWLPGIMLASGAAAVAAGLVALFLKRG